MQNMTLSSRCKAQASSTTQASSTHYCQLHPLSSLPFTPPHARHQPRMYLLVLGAARRAGPGLEDVRVVAQVCVRVAGYTCFARDKTSQRTRPHAHGSKHAKQEQSLQRKQQRLNSHATHDAALGSVGVPGVGERGEPGAVLTWTRRLPAQTCSSRTHR